MNGLLLLLVAPLIAAWGWVVWLIIREREARLIVPLLLLPTLAARHLLSPPPVARDFMQLLTDNSMPALSLDAAINLLAATATLVICSSLRERNRAEEVQWNTMETLCQLADFFATAEGSFEHRLRELLDLGCAQLGMEIGVLVETDESECEIVGLCAPPESGLARGDRLELDSTFCLETLSSRGAFCIEDTSQGAWAAHLAREIYQFESYIGIEVRLGSERYGALFFASRKARDARFGSADRTRLELMAHWTASAIAVQRSARDRSEFSRLQSAALDLSQASFEGAKGVDYVRTGLERIAKTLDLEGVAVYDHRADEGRLVRVASTGGDSPALASDVLAERLAPAVEARDVAAVCFGPEGDLAAEDVESAIVCVPITSLGRIAGYLAAHPHRARRFGAEELDYLRIGANLMADALGGLSSRGRDESADGESGDTAPRRLVPRRSETAERRCLDVHWAIERLADELRRDVDAPIELDLALASEPLEVPIYRYEFDRLLLSLIHHARQVNVGSGVTIETRRAVPPRAAAEEAYAVVTVRAPEVLLSAQDLDELFAPVSTSSPQERQLGVGQLPLPRVERLLRDAGGDLSVLSEPDRGTLFTAFFRSGPAA